MVMIYAGDHKVRTFAPTVNDPQWTALELKALNYLPLSGQWLKYVDRTQIIGTYQ
jgi:hypothetical protein